MADIPIAPVDRIMRKAGASRVSEEAAKAMADELYQYCMEIGFEAAKLAQHAGRKTVTPDDVKLAVRA